jgi:kinesin family protein 2/24
VTVRKRPAKESEKDVVFIQDGKVVQVAEPRTKVDLTKYTELHKFSFHEAFDENCSNEFIYSSTVQLVVDFVLSGGNGTCFAFGQTSSGKTFTMLGDSEANVPGLMTLGAHELLQRWTKRAACAQDGAACGLPPNALPHVSVSMLEIYGDEVFDLLHASRARKKVIPREDASKKVRLQSLTRMLMYADVC